VTLVVPVFHGDQYESRDLLAAIERNCQCVYDDAGVRTTTCGAHHLLLHDQRALDGILFERRRRECLEREEGIRNGED